MIIQKDWDIEKALDEIGAELKRLSELKENQPEVEFEDCGIGPYEYWGAKCVDTDIQPVWEDKEFKLTVENFFDIFPFTQINAILFNEEIKKLNEFCFDEIRYKFIPTEDSYFEYFHDIDFIGILSFEFNINDKSITFIIKWEEEI